MNIGPDGEPIFRIKKIFKRYDATDTGNALRFYDYFGGLFRYNVTDKCFMFWTGKTWVRDSKCIIKKYANKLIEIMQAEADDARRDASERMKSDDSSVKEEAKALAGYAEALAKNVCRLSNKAGKDAMIAEFQTLYDIPVESSEFNKDDYLLNTDSGIVSLRTGSVLPFDPSAMLSRNTNTKVSYEEPVTWMKFLRSVFDRGNDADTQQVIDCVQECLGYTLSGSNKQQVMFLLYGDGSNGKSTFSEEVMNIMGDYADAVSSQILMQQKSPNNSVMFTLAKLMFARFVETGETDEGNRLAEATLKNLTGDEYIAAQFKFGNEFKYRPHFKIWMATNSKPVIRGTNLGIWRRIFPFPFLRTFTDQNKDIYLPEKLKAESDRILGWCIRGFQKYYQKGEIEKPACLQREIQDYRDQMDVVAQFLKKQCEISKTSHVNCRVLYKEYKAWAFDNSEFCLKESKFSEEMEKKGYPAARFDGALCYSGVSLMSGPSSYSYSATRFGDE
jgi:putative DNA primase/helicase